MLRDFGVLSIPVYGLCFLLCYSRFYATLRVNCGLNLFVGMKNTVLVLVMFMMWCMFGILAMN